MILDPTYSFKVIHMMHIVLDVPIDDRLVRLQLSSIDSKICGTRLHLSMYIMNVNLMRTVKEM